MREVNFRALMRERGKIVPGSRREGHNLLTELGRSTLTQLVAWSSVADPDVPYTDHRFRWIGVGSGIQPLAGPIATLNTPLEITTGPSVYASVLDHTSNTFPFVTSVKLFKEFSTTDLSFGGAVTIREAALFMDSNTSSSIDPSVSTNPPAAYKVIEEGLVKMPSFTLEIEWEMKF